MDTKKLRQKILDLAIRGKLVPQDPNDEPASVLLERIRAEKQQLINEGKIKAPRSSKASDTSHYGNVPDGWAITSLGEVFTLQAGKNISASDIHENSDMFPYPCYGGNGIRGYVNSYNRNGHYPIIGRQGALCGNINEAYGEFYATEHAVVVETYAGVNVDWAVMLLIALNLNQYATATAQPGLSVATLNEVKFCLPPLQEQSRIASELVKWFSAIDTLEAEALILKDTISKTKSKILSLAISGKLVPQDPSDEPAINLLKLINPAFKPCDNSHYPFELPNGWIGTRVVDIFDINPKIQASDDSDAGFVPMASISEGFSDKFTFEVKKWAKIKNGFSRFANGDIAVAKISPCLENRKSVIMRDLPNGIGTGTTELNIFRSKIVIPEYGLLFFKSDYFVNACAGSYNGVVGQQRVSRSVIEDMTILVPPIEEQKRIVSTVNEYFAIIDGIENSLQ